MKSIYIHIPFCNNICNYCDFCKMYYNKKLVDDSLIGELKNKIVFDGGGDANSDWLAWKYITLVYPESPDFKNHNDAFYALFDKEYFENYTTECAKAIVEMLKE